jgi:hypothetical protein
MSGAWNTSRELVSSGESDHVQTRETTKLRRAPAAVVKLLNDPAVCQRAAEALNRVRGEPGQVRELWVFDVGDGYAVDDPSLDVTDVDYSDRVMYFFDRDWHYTVTLVGF